MLPGDYARIVDEHVQTLFARDDTFRQVAHGAKRREICQVGSRPLAIRLPAYFLQDGFEAFRAAAVQQHRSALRREFLGDAPAQAVGSARYQYRRLCRVFHDHSLPATMSQCVPSSVVDTAVKPLSVAHTLIAGCADCRCQEGRRSGRAPCRVLLEGAPVTGGRYAHLPPEVQPEGRARAETAI